MTKKERQAIADAASPIESLLLKLQAAYKWMKFNNDILHFHSLSDTTRQHDRNRLMVINSKVSTLPVLTDEGVTVFKEHKGNYVLRKSEYDTMIRKLTCSMMYEMV
jgi:hypothetical protein